MGRADRVRDFFVVNLLADAIRPYKTNVGIVDYPAMTTATATHTPMMQQPPPTPR
jgi:hypothetical protein